MSDLEEKIEKISKRLDKLENAVFGNKKPKIKAEKKYKGIAGGINFLIDSGFLNALKSSREVHKELKKEGYHYRKEAVDTALRRDFVGSKKILTRDKDGKIWKYVIRK
ncbi:MAG: hypothetical protein IIA82_08050 [Thaumarchaeota archaeon]|nr:hypothetical protein [Nitrososphaerota archaeon]